MKTSFKIFFRSFFILLCSFLAFQSFNYYLKDNNYFSYIPVQASLIKSKPVKKEKYELDLKIGQVFIISIKGKQINPEIEKTIKKLKPGGILLLGENIENEKQLKEFVFSLQKISLKETGIPLFIAVDQEGGLFSRIPWFPNDISQSQLLDEKQAYNVAKSRGEKLKALGINLNFSPLLDQSFKNDFLFKRSFQKGTEESGRLGLAMARGYKESGIFFSLKHFPGYGGVSFNPERKLAVFEKSPKISQFIEAGKGEPEFVMTANAVYKDISEKLPFSFSSSGIEFLRKNLKGDYLIISDDLSQDSLLNNFSLKDIVSLPFSAGLDILLFSNQGLDPEKAIEAFKESLQEGKIDLDRLNNSFNKIIKIKENLDFLLE